MTISKLLAMLIASGLVLKMIANGSIMSMIAAITNVTRIGLGQFSGVARGLSSSSTYVPGAYR